MVRILVNGEVRETPGPTVADLLRELGITGPGVAVAVNDTVVRRNDHACTLLRPEDRVEIIRAVQGG